MIRRSADGRASYGHRRVTALLNRELQRDGIAPVNPKWVYRLMSQIGLLLGRHTGRGMQANHDSKVIALRSNLHWCSDTFEIHLCHHLVRDRADELGGNLGAVRLGQETLDLAYHHPAEYIAMILSSMPAKRRSGFGIQKRRIAGIPITRHLDPDRPIVGQHRLAGARVTLAGGLRLPGPLTQMMGHLSPHRPLDNRLRQ